MVMGIVIELFNPKNEINLNSHFSSILLSCFSQIPFRLCHCGLMCIVLVIKHLKKILVCKFSRKRYIRHTTLCFCVYDFPTTITIILIRPKSKAFIIAKLKGSPLPSLDK